MLKVLRAKNSNKVQHGEKNPFRREITPLKNIIFTDINYTNWKNVTILPETQYVQLFPGCS